MRTKQGSIEAIVKRIKEVIEATEYVQKFTITIKGGVDEITTIEYDIAEAVNDWKVKHEENE